MLEEQTLFELGEIPPWVQYTPDKILSDRYRVIRIRMPYWWKRPRQPMSHVIKEFVWEKRSVSDKYCQPSLLQWVKKWYHIEPPPGASHVWIQREVTVPPGVLTGVKPTMVTAARVALTNLFTVPRDHILYVRWIQILMYDSDYESIFIGLLDNQYRAYDLESQDTTVEIQPPPFQILSNVTAPIGGLFPSGFHNVLLALDEAHVLGVSVLNNHVAERIVKVGIWGWKVHKTCLDEYLLR